LKSNYEDQLPINSILNDKIKKNQHKKPLESTDQTRDSRHEIKITS